MWHFSDSSSKKLMKKRGAPVWLTGEELEFLSGLMLELADTIRIRAEWTGTCEPGSKVALAYAASIGTKAKQAGIPLGDL
jgi:hypothetical protein